MKSPAPIASLRSLSAFVALFLMSFSPVDAGESYEILTLGDSITGFNKYQQTLKALLEKKGANFKMVGALGTAPDLHQGVSGIGINGIEGSIIKTLDDAFGSRPPAAGTRHVVMLQAGVNNMNHGLGIQGAQAEGYPRDAEGRAIAPQLAAAVDGSFLNGLGTSFGAPTYGTEYLRVTVANLVDKIAAHPSEPLLVMAKIPPVGRGNKHFNANTENCNERIKEFNLILTEKIASMRADGKKVVLVDNFTAVNRDYGTSPPSDFGTESEQGGENVADGKTSENNGDWVHPRNNAPLWEMMGRHFFEGLMQLTEMR